MLLREDQWEVVKAAIEAITHGRYSILIVGPTAWGKTGVLCAIAEFAAGFLGEGTGILWVAHRDRLLAQAVDTMHRLYPETLRHCVFLNTGSPRMIRAGVLVVDEGHHDAARSYQRNRTIVEPTIVIAGTATAQRHDDLGLNFAVVLTAPEPDDLIAQGILAEYDHYALDAETNAGYLVSAYLSSRARWGQSLLFVKTVEDAHRAVARIRVTGIRAAPALGDRGKEAAMAAFTAGAVEVLVTCNALTEGVDLPVVQSVFIRDGLRTPVMQAVGRALRKHGDKVARVVQFSTAKVPYFTIARPRRRWLGTIDGHWIELPVDPTWPAESDTVKTRLAQNPAITVTPTTEGTP